MLQLKVRPIWFLSLLGLAFAISFASPATAASGIMILSDGRVGLDSAASNVAQIAISPTADFSGTAWQPFDAAKFQAIGSTRQVLYVKFRTQAGAVSEVTVYHPVLSEGDIVRSADSPDVYIIKYQNGKKYKRLILSPSVFVSYGHLKWSNLKVTTAEQLGQYTTSNLVRVAGDGTIFLLTPDGDEGKRKVWDAASAYDADSVYEINAVDRNSYLLEGASSQPLSAAARVVFLHHSTGGVIWNGGVAAFFSRYNSSHDKRYAITATDFPKASPYGWNNYPYDYWNIWVNHAGSSAYLGEPTLEMLTQSYDVIVWKHCFPVSGIAADSGAANVASSAKTLQNYKLQYAALKAKMHQFPDKRFIVWTGAALVERGTNAADAARARDFATWVKATWDEPGDNIYVWDFRNLESGGGLYLLPENAASVSDSHPNSAFAARVAPLFAQRVIDVIEGRG